VTQDELNVLVAELRMDATSSEYPTRDQRAERAADEIERLSAEVTRLTAAAQEQAELRGLAEGEARALLDLMVEQCRAGGFFAFVEWRKAGYPGGRWVGDSIATGAYHFADRASAVAAIRAAAGLDGGGAG
jgi:hypothetical protein